MRKTYYVVCNVNGPISVRIEADSASDAEAKFGAVDERSAIDEGRTDAEADLGIDGTDMTEDEFAEALGEKGYAQVRDLSPIHNYHSGTTSHLSNGWELYAAEKTYTLRSTYSGHSVVREDGSYAEFLDADEANEAAKLLVAGEKAESDYYWQSAVG